jgi:hypothetical protein
MGTSVSPCLHARLIQDLVHQEAAPALLVVLLGQDESADLDEVGLQLGAVPLREEGAYTRPLFSST